MDFGLVLPGLPVADMIYAFKTSNFLSGKLIVVILLGFSIVAWTVMLTKMMELRRARAESDLFLKAFRSQPHPLTLFVKQYRFERSPLYKVYENACAAVSLEMEVAESENRQTLLRDITTKAHRLSPMQLNAIRNASERSMADQALLLESQMGFLALAVSTSPLLGLLGTVWGVLDSFAQMGMKGMANLSAVAPGLSGALLTTVIGLLVALPSTIGYNLLTSRIRYLCVQMDNFADEYVGCLQRTFLTD